MPMADACGSMKSGRSKKNKKLVPAPRVVAAAEPTPPTQPAIPWWQHLVAVLGLLAVNLALYAATARLGFLMVDDPDYVLNNPYIESFSASNLKHIFTTPYAANYAPANLLSYAVDIAIGGKNAAAFHFSNVIWHGWVACSVYFLAFIIFSRIYPAAMAALFFLLHPAHVEVVAWISSRKDLVATCFAVLAMACYLLYRRRSWRYVRYAASLFLFALGSAGKQSVLLLPVVMLAWDVFVEKRRNWQMIADKIPFGLVTLFFGWMTWHAQPPTNQALSILTMARTELTNLWLLTGCGTYALYRSMSSAADWSILARAGVVICAIAVWAVPFLLYRERQPVRAALSCWVLFQMVPPMLLSFIVPVTDRYLFLPSVGICILAADLVFALALRWQRAAWTAWTLGMGLAMVWCVKTFNYVGEWGDPRSVWYGAHFKTKNPEVFQFLGEIYQDAGEHINNFIKSGAPLNRTNELKFAQAVLSDPERVAKLDAEWQAGAGPKTNSIAYRDELWNFAWEQYRTSLSYRGKLSTPNLFMDRGRLLVSQGKYANAVGEFQTALAYAQASGYALIRQETVTHALRSIGVAYWNLQNFRESEQWYLKALDVQNKSGQVWVPTLQSELEEVRALAAAHNQ
jgi:hypothetical protein